MMKRIMLLLTLWGLVSCSEQGKNQPASSGNQQGILVGKKLKIVYPMMTAEVAYYAQNLHWKITDDKGRMTEGDETPTYSQIGARTFFVNWVEKDLMVVSQIVDLDHHQVKAFVYNPSQQKRKGDLIEGKIEEMP